jgi:lipopolysaccharide/colanic/teichoic acid biosynthesis glycosyltransferase
MPLRDFKEVIVEYTGEEVWSFVEPYLELEREKNLLLATSTIFNITNQPTEYFTRLVNLKRVNDVRYLNKFFEAINAILPVGGIYINSVQTYRIRKEKILRRFFWPLNWVVYTIDVILRRIFPKLWFTKKLYFYATQGNNRVLSKAETFGRLYSCGFEIITEKIIDDELYYVCRKIKEPVFDNHPTYGPLVRLKRHGINGEIFNVYKMRTMHPFSEYLQEYVYNLNNLEDGGKFKDDFRVTSIGKVMRKFWLDELPMLINVAKGQMKLVGVRPLSRQYFGLYTEELKQKRNKFKPGLVPPFYVDMPKTLEEIMDSEMRYLIAYEKRPFITDWTYFWKAMYNIFIRHARSN